jgi:hypothetical protein
LLLCGTGFAGEVAPAAPVLKPLVDLRLRYEGVDQQPLAEDAHALLLRARLGFETARFAGTTLLAEGEFLWPLKNDYRPDPAIPSLLAYPVVADADTQELNRLQLTNTSLPGTTLTLGRQRINLDDQRFVGNVGWRMNEQTFDALRAVNRSVRNLTVDVTWVDQVNRVFGQDSPQGKYDGNSFLGNVAYQFRPGKLTAFAYLVEIEPLAGVPAAVRDSSATLGVRFAGDRAIGTSRFSYLASYATQKEYADNPLDFELDYYLLEVGATLRQLTVAVGYEVLEGDGIKGFTTPLATLHRFQGWADKFLATPVNGIEDRYLSAGWTAKSIGPLESLAATVVWHEYRADATSLRYGEELNLQLQAKRGRFTGLVKYADYRARGLLTDTSRLWLQVEFVH